MENREFAAYVSLHEHKEDGSATTFYKWNDQCPIDSCAFASSVFSYQEFEVYESQQQQRSPQKGFKNGLNLIVETAYDLIGKSLKQCPKSTDLMQPNSLQIIVFLGHDLDFDLPFGESKNHWLEHLEAGGFLTFIGSVHETYTQATELRNSLTQLYPAWENQIFTIFMPLLRIKGGMQCLPKCMCENQAIEQPEHYNRLCSKCDDF